MNASFILLRRSRKLLSLCGVIFCAYSLSAQVAGTRTIGVDYTTLAAAVADLNTNGLSGSVVINVPAGYTETAPPGGYVLGSAVLNASTSSGNTLTIQKSGSGADPLLTAPVGTSTSTDGIFIIQGTDYVTINGIDLTESAGNTTATTRMEWGYALVKLRATAPFDGCQNVTIENCTVTLNRLNTPTVGIYANNHTATSTTLLAITATTDAMNNCKFYGNTIQNTVTGISLRGYAAAAAPYTLYDQNNDVGGAGPSTGDTIRNFGGSTTGYGVNLQYQNNANVSYNIINNTAGGGVSATSFIYGIYTQSGTNVSVDVMNNTIQLTEGSTFSSLYGINTSCFGTGTVNVNNNTLTANGGSGGSMYMIYFGGGNANVNVAGNSFYNINIATTGSLYMIYNSSAATPESLVISNNSTGGPSAPYVNKTGSGGTVAGIYDFAFSSSGTATITNNSFTHFNLTGSTFFYGIYETGGSSTAQNKFVSNNTVSHVTSSSGTQYGMYIATSLTESITHNSISFLNPGTGTIYGLYVGFGTNTDTVANNSINNMVSTGGSIYGMYVSSGTNVNVYADTINTLSSSSTSSFVYGLYQSTTGNVNIYRDKIYDIAETGTSGSAYGLYLNNGTVTAYNNLIGDIRTPNYNGAGGTQLAGIYVNNGTADYIYYNSVYLNASSTGANFGSAAIYTSTTPPVTLRNNIFVNQSTPAGTGISVAYRRNTSTLTTYQAASNNNLFYAGTPGTSHVIFYDGTTTYVTLADFQALVSPRDANSVTELPPFVSTTGPSPLFLRISPTTPTQVESGAVNIPGITTDFYNNIRQGNPGYTGTGTAPDIGAIEGNYTLRDITAPAITYGVLGSGCSTGDRTFTATITDATGVPTTGTLVPRVYFRKEGGSWFSNAGTLVSGSSTNGTWSFTISAAPMGGLAIGDTVFYFVIAQDLVSPTNIGANPGAGLVATDVNTITTFPTSPNSYVIFPVLTGTYNIGTGGDYTTITAAVAAYNSSCISGNVVFQLTDATYPSETFPITINGNVASSPTNTLTIRPAPGAAPVITGSSTPAIFVLNGADYVTIDGSNSPVTNSVCPPVTSSRDMTISNTSTSTLSAVIWLQTSSGGDSATHNTIRNLKIIGSGNSFTMCGVGSGGTSVSYTSLGSHNNGNRIENDSIVATQTGIFSMGAGTVAKNTGTVINQNVMNATTSPNFQRNNGILVGYEDGIVISGNTIANIANSISNDIMGIDLGFPNNAISTSSTTGNEVTNAMVTNNRLDNLKQTNTYSCIGIAAAGATSGTNTIANNMISGVLSNGTFGDFSAGILIGGAAGGTTHVYYNAVDMSGTVTGAGYPTFAIAISGSNPIVELKNNLFVNTASTGTTLLYAIGLAYTTYSNLSSDYNDFFSVGPNMGVVGGLTGFGTNQPTLAAWQATTGGDTHSQNVEPVFASPSDLHLIVDAANIPLMDAGTPVSVINDIDCNARSASTPDMGVNEFTIPACGSVTAGTASPGTPAFCDSGFTTITLSGASVGVGIGYTWESSTDSVSWTVIPGATSSRYTTSTIFATTFYRVVLRCSYSGLSDSATTRVTIYPLPTITVTPDGGGICSGSAGLTMTASGASTYSWSPTTALSTGAGPTVTATPTVTTTYTVTGTDVHGCVNTHASTVTVTNPPDTFTISPSSVTMCEGAPAVLLTTSAATRPAMGPDTASSGAISVVVPDATPGGASTSLSISGIPMGATITSVAVNFNITMTFDADLTLNLTAPDGSTINLVNRRGGAGDNFTNTTVSSAGGLSFATGIAPFTGTYAADRALGAGSTTIPVTTTSWSDLFNLPNGTWTFSARDWAGGDVATITSWSLIINYTYNPSLTWSPVAGLFKDAGETIPYTGDSATSIYARPAVTTTYTATLSLGACSNSTPITVTVIPIPHAGPISGPSGVCVGSTVAFTDSVTGGTWLSVNSNATVSSSGMVTGVTAGPDTILYAVSNSCGTDTARIPIRIEVFPGAGSITGPPTVCESSVVTLTDAAPGGVWSSSSGHAAVDSGGHVRGISAGDATISYSVTNSCGTAVATHPMTVNPLPHAGFITGFSSVCVSSVIYLSDPFPGGVWSATNGNASVSSTGVVIGVSAGTDTVRYTVTNVCGADTASQVVTVNPLPYAGAISGPSAVCVGSSITLTDTASGGTWVRSNANATLSTTGVVTGVTAGADTISYTVANVCGVATATHIVTVNPLPDAGVITGFTRVCTGQTVTLSASVPGGIWSSSGSSATVSSTGVVTGVTTGTVLISYSVTNACGTAVALFPVSVFQSPLTFTVAGGGAYCAGGAGVDVSLSGSQSGMSYQLFNGTAPVGSAVAGTGGALDFGMQTAAGTYTVEANNPSSGCTVTMSGSATVIVNPTIPPTVSITAPSFTVCTGSAITLTAVPVNGGASPTYQWQVNGVNMGTGSIFTYTPADSDRVRVIITSTPCAMPDTGCATVVIRVASFVTPSVTITASPGTTVCAGTTVTFSAHLVFGGAAPFIRWTKNGVNVATGPAYITVPANGDNVYAMLASDFACRLVDTVLSNHLVMTVVPELLPSVTIIAHPGTVIRTGQSDTLMASVTNGGPSPTYQWYLNGVAITGATNMYYISHSFVNRDSVSVVVTSSGECAGLTAHSSVVLSVGNVGIQQVANGNDVRLLPNPNKGTFMLKGNLAAEVDDDVSIQVTDMLGQVVYRDKFTARNGVVNQQVSLDGSLANGMYMLTMHTGSGDLTFHFVLEQ